MISWLIIAQLAATDPRPPGDAGSPYSTAALRAFVHEAGVRNRQVPAGFQAYRASTESEIAIVARRAEGIEGVFSVEQVASEVRWRLPGDFEQRVVGYRNQALGFQFSSLSFIQQPWVVPILYGDRLSLLFGRDTSRAARRRAERQRTIAVHPLASDRELHYTFSGGDTVVTMRVGGRELPIVRVLVEPRADPRTRTLLFRGELDIDATRHHLVRMRGYFVAPRPRSRSLATLALGVAGFEAVAFVELENGEFEGKVWLPVYQRFEAQAAATGATDARSVFRIVSRYQRHQLNDTTLVAMADTLVPMPFRLQLAPTDSLGAWRGWRRELGGLSGGLHADDFDDLAPDAWRPTGPPRTNFRVQRVMDLAHVNRVEGLYTGWGVQHRFRDQVPGLTLRANAGWAWSEGTARGRASAELVRGRWTLLARGGRTLDITNDFRSPFDSGSTLGALLGQDNYDYVDRRLGAVGIHRRLGKGQSIWRVETGPARDVPVRQHLARGLFRGDSGFRENRGADRGSYWRTWSALEWHPDVNAEFMRTGVGGLMTVEHATGQLDYTRLDGRLVGRRNAGRVSLAARGDAGIVLGGVPPAQQLYELGENQNLQGYDYKQFAGDRALVGRGLAMWRAPLLEAPVRVGRWLLPGLAPALAVGSQAAWTDLSSAAAQSASQRLTPNAPRRDDTGGVRASVTLGLRFFGGAIGVGMARPVDRAGPWKLRVDFGQVL